MFYNFLINNFTYIREHLVEWSLQGYEIVLGVGFYALIFSAIIGYVYLKQQSAVAAVAIILILITAFGGIFVNFSAFTNILFIMTAIVITCLFLVLVIRKRGGI